MLNIIKQIKARNRQVLLTVSAGNIYLHFFKQAIMKKKRNVALLLVISTVYMYHYFIFVVLIFNLKKTKNPNKFYVLPDCLYWMSGRLPVAMVMQRNSRGSINCGKKITQKASGKNMSAITGCVNISGIGSDTVWTMGTYRPQMHWQHDNLSQAANKTKNQYAFTLMTLTRV